MMNKTVIITGVSRGIGAASAKVFLTAGWQVLGLSRSPCPLDGVEHLAVDLVAEAWEAEVSAWLDEVAPAKGGVLSLIHNAAGMAQGGVLDAEAATFRAMMELNVIAPLRLNQLVHPRQGAGSSIIYLGSTLSEKAVPGAAAYVTSKHAVAGLMRATCQDLAGTGVHSVCVAPGFTATEMLMTHLAGKPDARAAVEAMSTFGRLIEPSEIAATILFAAENPVLNGAILHANLGQIER